VFHTPNGILDLLTSDISFNDVIVYGIIWIFTAFLGTFEKARIAAEDAVPY
jgi:hypothetical protein